MGAYEPLYTVAFKALSGGEIPAGTVSWTSYESKERFDALRPDLATKHFREIIAEGITADDAYQLYRRSREATQPEVECATI